MNKSLSDNALAIYKKLYFSEKLGETTPTEVHHRVAKFAASKEDIDTQNIMETRFFELLENNLFRPNTPTMMNAGVHPNPQTSACFVGDLKDDMDAILDFNRESAIIYKQGSGIGGNYGMLREKNAPLSGGGCSSGPVQFLRLSGMTAHAIKSGGSSRRAAHMAMITDTHPDLLDFIKIKAESEEFVTLPTGEKTPLFSSMNLSVAITDKFMNAVENNEDWNLVGVVDGLVKKTLPAKKIFEQIVSRAWTNGDPGVWFIDRANETNTIPSNGKIVCSNPCGEQSLLPRQACGLGAINVAEFVTLDGHFDWEGFEETVEIAVRFLDNCIDLSGFPTPAYEKMAKDSRPIGLGIMGFADALILMGIKYDSKDTIAFAEQLSKRMTAEAIRASAFLAEEKGPFPLFKDNKEAVLNIVQNFTNDVGIVEKYGVRNSQWTTIAPTGSTSISCDCSQGMEPLFAICYDKKISDSNEVWTFANEEFKKRFHQMPWFDEAIKAIIKNHGSIAGICLPAETKCFECSHDIKHQDRLKVQAALQQGISNSISSTINLPNSTEPKVIADIFRSAWKMKLKGVTVYRDGCLKNQPVNFGKMESAPDKTLVPPPPVKRPSIRSGFTHEVKTGHGKIYITVNCNEKGDPIEIFTNGGKNGSVNAANLEAMARLVSIALQEGVSAERLARTIENINDGTVVWERLKETDKKPQTITSIPDAMAKVLKRFYCNNSRPEEYDGVETGRCPDCNSPMFMHDGCEFCPQCGSKCG